MSLATQRLTLQKHLLVKGIFTPNIKISWSCRVAFRTSRPTSSRKRLTSWRSSLLLSIIVLCMYLILLDQTGFQSYRTHGYPPDRYWSLTFPWSRLHIQPIMLWVSMGSFYISIGAITCTLFGPWEETGVLGSKPMGTWENTWTPLAVCMTYNHNANHAALGITVSV